MIENPKLELKIEIIDDAAEDERLNETTLKLMKNLRNFDIERIERPQYEDGVDGKGDMFTLGVLIIVLAPTLLPDILQFLSNWTVERRKINVEAPNGCKIEFIPNKKYDEKEILELIKKLNNI